MSTPQPTPQPAPAAAHPSASPTTAYLADEVGHLSLGFLLIDATRYNLGRPGAAASGYVLSLTRTLPLILPHIRQQLVQDIAHALHKDAIRAAVAAGRPTIDTLQQPLLTPADRAEWRGLLQVAEQLGTAPDEFRHAAGS